MAAVPSLVTSRPSTRTHPLPSHTSHNPPNKYFAPLRPQVRLRWHFRPLGREGNTDVKMEEERAEGGQAGGDYP